ncbi:hypothetical protein SNL152K_5180 [Streptomyces sp. NL15-2K]|nr:hypothetical protein SNL152K_5180 [Streptomyces sp. NL15-2K]
MNPSALWGWNVTGAQPGCRGRELLLLSVAAGAWLPGSRGHPGRHGR